MTADMIQPEINCLLKSEDKWFRGIILDNTKLEAIAVQCPDTGRQFEVDSKNVSLFLFYF